MIRLFTLILFFFALSSKTFAANPLVVEASLKPSPNQNLSPFVISTKIKNISNTTQTVVVWSGCYGWSWIADKAEIVTGIDSCRSNFPSTIKLNPEEEISRDIQIGLTANLKPGTIKFQLGFTPKADWIGTRIGIIPKPKLPKSVIWSNDITLTITAAVASNLALPSKELVEKSKNLYCPAFPCKKL